MGMFDKFSNKNFWIAVLKLAVVFFAIFVVLSILIASFSDVMSGNWSAVYEEHWSDGKWKRDLGIKAAITFVYAVYMTSRRGNYKKQEE